MSFFGQSSATQAPIIKRNPNYKPVDPASAFKNAAFLGKRMPPAGYGFTGFTPPVLSGDVTPSQLPMQEATTAAAAGSRRGNSKRSSNKVTPTADGDAGLDHKHVAEENHSNGDLQVQTTEEAVDEPEEEQDAEPEAEPEAELQHSPPPRPKPKLKSKKVDIKKKADKVSKKSLKPTANDIGASDDDDAIAYFDNLANPKKTTGDSKKLKKKNKSKSKTKQSRSDDERERVSDDEDVDDSLKLTLNDSEDEEDEFNKRQRGRLLAELKEKIQIGKFPLPPKTKVTELSLTQLRELNAEADKWIDTQTQLSNAKKGVAIVAGAINIASAQLTGETELVKPKIPTYKLLRVCKRYGGHKSFFGRWLRDPAVDLATDMVEPWIKDQTTKSFADLASTATKQIMHSRKTDEELRQKRERRVPGLPARRGRQNRKAKKGHDSSTSSSDNDQEEKSGNENSSSDSDGEEKEKPQSKAKAKAKDTKQKKKRDESVSDSPEESSQIETPKQTKMKAQPVSSGQTPVPDPGSTPAASSTVSANGSPVSLASTNGYHSANSVAAHANYAYQQQYAQYLQHWYRQQQLWAQQAAALAAQQSAVHQANGHTPAKTPALNGNRAAPKAKPKTKVTPKLVFGAHGEALTIPATPSSDSSPGRTPSPSGHSGSPAPSTPATPSTPVSNSPSPVRSGGLETSPLPQNNPAPSISHINGSITPDKPSTSTAATGPRLAVTGKPVPILDPRLKFLTSPLGAVPEPPPLPIVARSAVSQPTTVATKA